MTTLAAHGSGTPATTGTTWATPTNAVDGAAGTNPATYATATNATASAVQTIEITGYGFSSSIAATDTLNSVTVSLRHFENNTGRFASVTFQAFDGATAIGTATTATLATAARNDTATPAVTLTQLRSSTFKIRVTITGAASTQSRVESIDYVDVTADYTPAPPAITQAAYRFYGDGTETASTALAAQDTGYTADTSSGDVNLQVRARLQSTNTVAPGATDDWQLQWEKNTSGTWTAVVRPTGILDAYPDVNWFSSFTSLFTTGGNVIVGQSFLGDGQFLTRAGFYLYGDAGGNGTVTAVLYAHTGTFGSTGTGTGGVLATSTTSVDVTTLTSSPVWTYFDFDRTFTLANGTPYVICVTTTNTFSGAVKLAVDAAPTQHAGNQSRFTTSWVTATSDSIFEVYSGPASIGTTAVAYNSPNLTDGAATTNRLGAGTGSFVAGEVSETGLVTDLGWTANNYTELLYSVTLKQADLTPTDTLRFRVLRNGATTAMTYTATPTITIGSGGPVSHALAGQTDGTSTVTAAVVVARALTATTTAGLSTTAGTLTTVVAGVAVALAGTGADGTSTTTGAVAVARPLASGATGTSTTTGAISRAVPVAATADGTSTTTAAAIVARTLAGTTDGTSTTAGTLTGVTAHPLAATSTGTSTTTGSLAVGRPLAATSDGTSTTVAALAGARPTAGTADGTSTTTATLIVARALAGRSDGTSGADGSFGGAIRALAGTSDGAAGQGTAISATLLEPFDNYTSAPWTLNGSPTIVTGRTGNGANITGVTQRLNYAIPTINQDAVVTIGFAYRTPALQASNNTIVNLYSDTNATFHTGLSVNVNGALIASRAGTGLATSATGLIVVNTWYYLEAQYKLGDSPTGYAIVRVNGVEVINSTGLDTKNGGTKTVYDAVRLGPVNSSTGGTNQYDDLYVDMGPASTFKGDLALPVVAGGGPIVGILTVARALTAASVGLSTADGTLAVARVFAGTSAGSSTTVAAIAVARALTATTTGTSTTTATLTATPAAGIVATSTGTSTVTGTIVVARALTAGSTGTSTAAAALVVAIGALMRIWTGTTYTTAPVNTWTGTTYVAARAVKTWNGSSYV